MKYKLLLLDIDGTLTASKGDALPSKKVVAAVKEAQKHLTVAVATGRPRYLAQPVIDALDLHGFGIFNSGAEVINTITHKVEVEQFLSVSQLRELVRLSLPFGYDVFTDDDHYETPVRSPEQIKQPAAKFFISGVGVSDIPAMLAELTSVAATVGHPTTSWVDGDVMDIHVTHELATKRHGAEHLIRLLGYHKDEIVAVGDGYNDVPLLEIAGLKVAMGNAPDEVKAVADYVAPSLTDDGVAEVIERFIVKA